MSKKTLVVGASTNPERYSFKAIHALRKYGHEVIAYGLKSGEVDDVVFTTQFPMVENIDTVTIYVGPRGQSELIPKIIELKPNRVIFNPGTENNEAYELLNKAKIPYEESCTLVLLSIGQY